MSTAQAPEEILNLVPADQTAPPLADEKHEPRRPTIANVPGRLGTLVENRLRAIADPRPWKRRLARAALVIPKIRHWEQQFINFNEEDLRKKSMNLRGRVRGGEHIDKLIPEAFALAAIAIRRLFGYQLFDVQLAAGIVMHYGGLVELATGEGKTLCAVSPAYLNSLENKGVHVTTVNDYLAKRDAEEMGPVYRMLGLTVGCIQQKMEDGDRTLQYKCDVTYGTAAEFGFDFLRDRLKVRGGQSTTAPFWAPWTNNGPAKMDPRVQRPLHYAIVDEADSIFVDEARTPLIIANPTRDATPEEQIMFKWADGVAKQMQRDEHFRLDLKKDKIEILDSGRTLVRYSNPPTGQHAVAMDKLLEQVEKSLHAYHRFSLDHQYIISKDGKIIIIDEGTGRPMPDRHWRDGLHQAVEVKESVQVTMPSEHAAQVTFQNFYRLYKKLAGMSGTLMPNFSEMRRVYRRWVTKIPTNRPIKRVTMLDAVAPNEGEKFDAVVKQVREMVAQGRPVLIGTRTVDKSERLSKLLELGGVEHLVLNARQDANEAQIIGAAGQLGRVTVATNMAGRGTDIKLGPGVAENGGLHVIGTERHEAERIDRQLAGRAGRQGDPGTAQFFISLEDGVLEGLGQARQQALEELGRSGSSRPWSMFRRLFRKAQKRIEKKHYKQRLDLMHYDRGRQEMLQDLGADPYVD
ncbi:preprotein translocase subunit SecA [Limnoglobus roseus]|uniref:Protein translocase subunit SecA n=1 Tax=Limnoglobus roseus TaxID=2598579 RepID=A0A5C1APG1_9BACT|nr:preprotein translocase subunit SecA [Limnoglobus roseus]QEL20023.1 preprotein translocase subunit SecA [Limnoglobus roseus]